MSSMKLRSNRTTSPRVLLASMALTMLLGSPAVFAANYCPAVWKKGVLPVNFNPAFTTIDQFNAPGGGLADDLVVSSFFNVLKDPTGTVVTSYYERDLVARIRDVGAVNPLTFNPNTDVEVLTDRGGPPYVNNWTNSASRVPDGVVPFEALVMPQGFHPAIPPGRLSLINLDDPNRQEYIVHQSNALPGGCTFTATNFPHFYHDAKFVDMDGDGLKDIVTVRSSFKVAGPGSFCFFTGDLVYFTNPGPALAANVQWAEHILTGYPAGALGPDIALDEFDFENDGIPEIVATRFFGGPYVRIFGAPAGQNWSVVNQTTGPFVRQQDISTTQGSPFGVEIVDLNLDGKMDVLATNHQTDNCFSVTQTAVPGRVIAFEQPVGGVFTGTWTTRILKDNIRPNPTYPAPTAGPGRLAPGHALAFTPVRGLQGKVKPWIVVSGDEASKVWLLTPKSPSKTNWEYLSAVVFDINDTYGPLTTQTIMGPTGRSPGEVISTIGTQSVRYDGPGPTAQAQIYIPVFEGKEIHVLSLRPGAAGDRVVCPPDVRESCPVLP